MDKLFYMNHSFAPAEMFITLPEEYNIIKINNIEIVRKSVVDMIFSSDHFKFNREPSGYVYFTQSLSITNAVHVPFNLTKQTQFLVLDYDNKDPYKTSLESVNWEQDLLDFRRELLLNN